MALQWPSPEIVWLRLSCFSSQWGIYTKTGYLDQLRVHMVVFRDYTEKRFVLKKPYKGRGIIKTSVSPGNELIILFHIKSQSLPQTVTLPNPKIYNLIWSYFSQYQYPVSSNCLYPLREHLLQQSSPTQQKEKIIRAVHIFRVPLVCLFNLPQRVAI